MAWSSLDVSGVPVNDFCEMRGHHDHEAAMQQIAEEVRDSAYEIIKRKKATYYGVAMAVKRICEAIIRDEKSVLPVSAIQRGNYGVQDIALSMPAIVGRDGIEAMVPIRLNAAEYTKLSESAATLKKVIDETVQL